MNEPEIAPAPGRNPFRCYDRRFLFESLLFALAIVGIAFASKRVAPGSPLRLVAAVLESAAFAWIAARSVLSIRRLDELQQRIHLVAIAVSFTAAGVVMVALEFFEGAGLAWRPWGAEMWAGMVVVWMVTVVVLNRRYR